MVTAGVGSSLSLAECSRVAFPSRWPATRTVPFATTRFDAGSLLSSTASPVRASPQDCAKICRLSARDTTRELKRVLHPTRSITALLSFQSEAFPCWPEVNHAKSLLRSDDVAISLSAAPSSSPMTEVEDGGVEIKLLRPVQEFLAPITTLTRSQPRTAFSIFAMMTTGFVMRVVTKTSLAFKSITRHIGMPISHDITAIRRTVSRSCRSTILGSLGSYLEVRARMLTQFVGTEVSCRLTPHPRRPIRRRMWPSGLVGSR